MLPLALGCIVLATAVPVELRHRVPWATTTHLGDVGVNLLLYMPLGWALWRRPLLWVALAALVLSGSIEWLQAGYANRHPTTLDVICNTVGAMIGWWLARISQARAGAASDASVSTPEVLRIRPWIVAACALGALAMGAHWFLPLQTHQLASWDESFRLRLGREDPVDTPWRGVLRDLQVMPGLFAGGQVLPLKAQTGTSTTLSSNAWPATDDMRRFVGLAKQANAFTMSALIRVDAIDEEEPQSIVSLANGASMRNFNLAQSYGRLALRIRTPLTGPDGLTPHVSTPSVLVPGVWHRVTGSFDGRIARIHVDGTLRGRSNLAAVACPLRSLCDVDLPLMAGLLGAMLGIVSAAWAARNLQQGAARSPLVAMLGATLGAALVAVQSASAAPIVLGAEAGLLALLGGASVAWAAWWGRHPTR